MRNIYLLIEGKQVGPLPEDQVKQFLAQGKIQADVLAWHDGLPEWVPFANLVGLSLGPSPERIPHAVSSADLVQIDGVKKSFGDKIALKNVSFSVPSGQICGLLGRCLQKSQLRRRRAGDSAGIASRSGLKRGRCCCSRCKRG